MSPPRDACMAGLEAYTLPAQPWANLMTERRSLDYHAATLLN